MESFFPGLEEYRRKRGQLLDAGVHVVEIDLVRRGSWRTLIRPYVWPSEAATTYRAIVFMGGEPREVSLYPFGLGDRFPVVSVPLGRNDKPASIEFQALLQQVYQHGRYHQRLDYRQPCDPPLNAEEAQLAERLLGS